MRKFILVSLLILGLAIPAFASVGVMINGTPIAAVTDINLAGGADYNVNGSVLNLGNLSNVIVNTTITTPNLTGGTINNATIGLTTAAAANVTTLNANVTTATNLTASGTLNVTGAVGLAGNTTLGGTILATNAQVRGNATLLNGTILVNSTAITANSMVLLNRIVNGSGTTGQLATVNASYNAGVNFTITSSAATDNSTVRWLIVN